MERGSGNSLVVKRCYYRPTHCLKLRPPRPQIDGLIMWNADNRVHPPCGLGFIIGLWAKV